MKICTNLNIRTLFNTPLVRTFLSKSWPHHQSRSRLEDAKKGRLQTRRHPSALHGPMRKESHCVKVEFTYPKIAPLGTKAKGLKKKGAGSSGSSSSMNDEALVRLIVFELAMHNKRAIEMNKEERLAFLEIRMREVEIRERELASRNINNVKKT
ncbi:hypothetical protein Tco_1237056 [Tanacetum coccineum]